MSALRIAAGDLDDARVAGLVAAHAAGVREAGMDLWTAWDGRTLLGIGALKRLDAGHGEVKAMHVVEAGRRRGAGSALLRHIVGSARAAGLSRLSLETGSWAYFEPARAFYARHGFTPCGPFGGYRPDPNSVFMTLDLRRGAPS